MSRFSSVIRAWARAQRGVIAIEFALILPILVLMFIGVVEVSRLMLISAKLDKLANAMADFATQGTTLSHADMDVFAQAASQIMEPYPFTGSIVFSSIATNSSGETSFCGGAVNCMTWQYIPTTGQVSRLGGPGAAATLPTNYTVAAGQNLIVAEVFYNYSPILLASTPTWISSLASQTLYRMTAYKPRQNSLAVLSP